MPFDIIIEGVEDIEHYYSIKRDAERWGYNHIMKRSPVPGFDEEPQKKKKTEKDDTLPRMKMYRDKLGCPAMILYILTKRDYISERSLKAAELPNIEEDSKSINHTIGLMRNRDDSSGLRELETNTKYEGCITEISSMRFKITDKGKKVIANFMDEYQHDALRAFKELDPCLKRIQDFYDDEDNEGYA